MYHFNFVDKLREVFIGHTQEELEKKKAFVSAACSRCLSTCTHVFSRLTPRRLFSFSACREGVKTRWMFNQDENVLIISVV